MKKWIIYFLTGLGVVLVAFYDFMDLGMGVVQCVYSFWGCAIHRRVVGVSFYALEIKNI